MKVEVFKGNWNRTVVLNNPNKLFVFGDNDMRFGKGGQAIIRDLTNTIGIRTKKEPNMGFRSFYTDSDYQKNCDKISDDISKIKSEQYDVVVFSNGGYGTGLARLKEKAPLTYEFLCKILLENFGYDNETGYICRK